MFGFGNPKRKLEQRYARIMKEARDAQRAGNIPLYARLCAAAEEVGEKLDEVRAEGAS